MATCKESRQVQCEGCLSKDVCCQYQNMINRNIVYDVPCRYFKDKTRFVELPKDCEVEYSIKRNVKEPFFKYSAERSINFKEKYMFDTEERAKTKIKLWKHEV